MIPVSYIMRVSYVTNEKMQQARALRNFIQPARESVCKTHDSSRWTHRQQTSHSSA